MTLILKIRLSLLAIPILFISSTHGHAEAICDLGNNSISLEIINKPLKEVLKVIEDQTEFKIEVQDTKALDDIKSIILKNCPLDKTFSRLLKNVNYSVICNDKQKSLSLTLFDKDNKTYAVSTSEDTGDSFLTAMNELDAMLEKYNARSFDSSNSASSQQQGEEPPEMAGVDASVEAYYEAIKNKNEEQLPPYQKAHGEEPPEMAGVDASVETYYKTLDNKAGEQQPQKPQGEEPPEMAGVDASVEAYYEALKNNNEEQQPPQQAQGREPPEMAGVDASVEAYYKSLDESK